MSALLSEQVVEDILEGNFRVNCFSYASAALLIYHVALNLPHDVRHLWGRRSIAILLSAINWLAITGTIITNMPLTQDTTQIIYFTRCVSSNYAFGVVLYVNTAIPPLVAALRVHVVSGGSWRWVLPVWLFGMVPVCTNIGALDSSRMLITTRVSVVISDILVVAATWYYISRTSSVGEQLVRGVWATRPNLTTVMFRNGTLYFMMSSILVSHFLICIREAAECSIQALGSQSLSFIDSQGYCVSQPWLSSIEFGADIANPSARDSNEDSSSDLEDDLDSRGEDDAGDAGNDGIELEHTQSLSIP
ncbi:hypothetical protein POSPLADRAFT_1137384 [Postia placenta MAD-698-R-SB12]|uniref:Uncharacterized protein n=1 Tax=Postia placenta MAD-698-R-SB12 TaxID=670580 RepID=A0A1X6N6B1_9APHY|nr:hypothetical protein POSPLADRAFT_1137384 [Postia placenta MAD-698-R-SB12]OSX63943.1 hypothetical protein POSPLADRAFT_1137384 [Postia placenta MAD-698-R-SB12]